MAESPLDAARADLTKRDAQTLLDLLRAYGRDGYAARVFAPGVDVSVQRGSGETWLPSAHVTARRGPVNVSGGVAVRPHLEIQPQSLDAS